jgi:hypothetical protein
MVEAGLAITLKTYPCVGTQVFRNSSEGGTGGCMKIFPLSKLNLLIPFPSLCASLIE